MTGTLPRALAILMAAAVLPLVATTPAEAACVNTSRQASAYRLADDDEMRTSIHAWARLYYTDCGQNEKLTGAQVGFGPWKHDRIDCGAVIFTALRMNLGHVGRNDPATRSLACRPYGNSTYINLTDTWNPRDRCAQTALNVYKSAWADRRLAPIGYVCVPR